jgi:hypothetical protein
MAKSTKTNEHAANYFDLEILPSIRNQFGTPYNENNMASAWYNETTKGLDYLISLISDSKKLGLFTVYKEKLNTQPGKFTEQKLKTYVVRGYSTRKDDNGIFIEIGISDLNTISPNFNIQFDRDKKLGKTNHFIKYLESPQKIKYDLSFPFDNTFPKSWSDLVSKVENQIEIMVNELNKQLLQEIEDKKIEGEQPILIENYTQNLNTILYGPPGTGKTFRTTDEAINLIFPRNNLDRSAKKTRFNQLQKNGRIFFTTFHQNMAYEDFIEGIKPMKAEQDDDFLKYEIQDGLFMRACIEATYDFIVSNFPNSQQVAQVRNFNQLYDDLFMQVENGNINTLTTLNGEVNVSVTEQGNFSITHQRGQRTYTVSRNRLAVLYDAIKNLNEVDNIVEEFRVLIGGCNSTAFWAVFNKIKELEVEIREGGPLNDMSYQDKRSAVISTWNNSEYVPVQIDSSNPFVFIIDEINRGNIAQIFGELITLIEEDKRFGKPEEIRLELPYSKQKFCVPPNLYIIGTMNTADRSVEALDTALRRRFSFIPMIPEYDGLNEDCDRVNLKLLLKKLNDRLTVLKDRDHTIGHAWLWNTTTIDSLRLAFKDKIIPLLQEFFYNDYEKLGLLLGDRFIQTEVTVNSNLFAPFEKGSGLRNQYANKVVYKITKHASWTSEAFQSIYINQ